MEGLSYEEALIQKSRRAGLLLDANLLLLYEIGRFNESVIGRYPHTKQYTREDYELLVKLIGLFPRVVTTPNILTEVSNLAGKLHLIELNKFRIACQDTIGAAAEHYCASSAAAKHPTFLKFGLTDAGIASLGKQGYLVLTDDLSLWHWLATNEIDALNFNHIRGIAWLDSGS